MHQKKHNITSSWIAFNLGVNSNNLSLYLESNRKKYLKQTVEKRMSLADKVQFYRKYTGIITIGTREIKTSRRIIKDCGYESLQFRAYVVDFNRNCN